MRVYAIDEKKGTIDGQKKNTLNENCPLTEKKNYPLNDKKNYPLNDKKNYPLNDKPCSLFIDLAKIEESPKPTENQRKLCGTSEKMRNASFFLQESSENKENQTNLGQNIVPNMVQKREESCENIENTPNLKEALLKSLNKSQNSYKIKKNAEELPGIIAYFELKKQEGITLSHRKFINDKGQSKVEITVVTTEEQKALAGEIVNKLKNYYFFKEIMLSHRKDRPFDLNRDFSEIKAEGRLIQILLEKMLRNKSLKIDETLNYEFIEHCQSDEKKKKKKYQVPIFYAFFLEERITKIRNQKEDQ